jgi:hypothetical protein
MPYVMDIALPGGIWLFSSIDILAKSNLKSGLAKKHRFSYGTVNELGPIIVRSKGAVHHFNLCELKTDGEYAWVNS